MLKKLEIKWLIGLFVAELLTLEFLVIEYYTSVIERYFGTPNGLIFLVGQVILVLLWLLTMHYFVFAPIIDWPGDKK